MKILAVGDSLRLPTGYGRVNQNVLGYFALTGHQVIQIGIGHNEPAEDILMQANGGELKASIKLVPPIYGDAYATQTVLSYIKSWTPDLVYNSNDFFTSPGIINGKSSLKFTFANYGIIDGEDCATSFKNIIQGVDIPVIPSKYGYELAKKVSDKCLYIPHGVNTGIFKPSNIDKNELKKKYGLQDKFIFGCVNRNILRKQHPNLIRAFANLKNVHGLKDIMLLLVCDPQEVQGYNLISWANHFGLTISQDWSKHADILLHPNFLSMLYPLDDDLLAETYNLFDVMPTASLSEGFGLSTIESQACGTPVIACDNTANTELIRNHGWLYPTARNMDGSEVFIPATMGGITYGYSMPDYYALELSMLEAYNNSELLKLYSRECLAFAREYEWSKVLPKWEQVLAKATA